VLYWQRNATTNPDQQVQSSSLIYTSSCPKNGESRSMLLQLLIIGVVIGSNNFATSLALGALGQEDKHRRILIMFGVFEFSIPLFGLWLGSNLSNLLTERFGWLGPLLIAGIGLWTLFQAIRETRDDKKLAKWLSSWGGLFFLSAGLSVDNLIIGFSLGLNSVPALVTATVIMTCSVAFTWIGLLVGGKGQRSNETAAEFLSGLLLLAIAWMSWSGWL
jgi:putative Mn2+ efflux pump MntP